MNLFRGAAALLALVVLPGCVSARYKPAPKGTPPAVVLNLTATDPALSAVLHTVIVYQGPGSWKRSAYWDEYVFSFANYGSTPMVVTGVELFDFTGQAATPGDNPWKVENQSRSDLSRLSSAAGTTLKIGAATIGVVTLSAAPMAAAGIFAATPAMVAVAAVAAPAFLVSTVVRNVNQRGRIEKEFTRRRLVLPVTLAPGEIRQGSLFLRISPGPTHAVLHYKNGDETGQLVLPLTPLASLHLTKPVPSWEKARLPRQPQYPPRSTPPGN